MAKSRKRHRSRKPATQETAVPRPAASRNAATRQPGPVKAPDSPQKASPEEATAEPPVIRPLTPEAWHRGLALARQMEEDERALLLPEEDGGTGP